MKKGIDRFSEKLLDGSCQLIVAGELVLILRVMRNIKLGIEITVRNRYFILLRYKNMRNMA